MKHFTISVPFLSSFHPAWTRNYASGSPLITLFIFWLEFQVVACRGGALGQILDLVVPTASSPVRDIAVLLIKMPIALVTHTAFRPKRWSAPSKNAKVITKKNTIPKLNFQMRKVDADQNARRKGGFDYLWTDKGTLNSFNCHKKNIYNSLFCHNSSNKLKSWHRLVHFLPVKPKQVADYMNYV